MSAEQKILGMSPGFRQKYKVVRKRHAAAWLRRTLLGLPNEDLSVEFEKELERLLIEATAQVELLGKVDASAKPRRADVVQFCWRPD